jgi:regulatory protein
MRVTRLEHDARTGGVRVQVDGRPFGSIAVSDIGFLGLAEDREIDEPKAAALAARAELWSARVVAMRIITSRALPARELERRLVRRGHAKPAAEHAVSALREMGLVNDEDFAKHYVRTHVARQRHGPRRILGDLRRLGVTEKIAQAAVSETMSADGVDQRTVLREAAEKKALTLGKLEPAVAQRRLRAFLLRRGFGGADVSNLVRELLAAR